MNSGEPLPSTPQRARRVVRWLCILGGVGLLLWAVPTAFALYSVKGSVNLLTLYGTKSILTMKLANKVEVVLLKDSLTDENRRRDKDRSVEKRTPTIELHGPDARAMSTLLLSDSSHVWEREKGCIPIWGARVIYSWGPFQTTVDFCFLCEILNHGKGSQDKFDPAAQANFDPAADDLLNHFLHVFPDDHDLLWVKETKSTR